MTNALLAISMRAPISVVSSSVFEAGCPFVGCEGLAYRVDLAGDSFSCPDCGRSGDTLALLIERGLATDRKDAESLTSSGRVLRSPEIQSDLARFGSLAAIAVDLPFAEIALDGAASGIRPELIPGIVGRGEVVLLYADAKVGKSNLAAELCARVTDGKHFLGIEPSVRTQVGWIDWDTSPADVVATLSRFGNAGGVRAFSGHGMHLDQLAGANAVIDTVRKLGLGFLVIDSLTGACQGDENSTREMRLAAEALKRIARETGCTVLYLHHSDKGGSEYRGSSTLKAGAHRVLRLKRGASDVVTLTVMAQRHGVPIDPIRFRRVQAGWIVRHEVLDTGASTSSSRDYRAEISEWLLENGPATRNAIAAGIKAGKGLVTNLVDAMLADGGLSSDIGTKVRVCG